MGIDHAAENFGFTKVAHKNKFKYMYTKFMTIVQNEYRNNSKCQENPQVGHDFACLTVCTLKTVEDLMGFYTARTNDSILGKDGCPNSAYEDSRKVPFIKRMNGLQAWLSSYGNEEFKGKLPQWAVNF